MGIGENIKRIRKEKGYTQKRLGELSGVNESQIRRYELEKQNSNPKMETLQKIANALEVDVNELYGLNVITQKPPLNIPQLLGGFRLKDYPNLINAFGSSEKNLEKALDYVKNAIPEERPDLLIKYFNQLNDIGQEKAVEYTRLLSRVPEYQKDSDPNQPDQN